MQPVTIQIERGVTFSGHVYDPNGKPVAGATVVPTVNGPRYSVQTDKDGSYRMVTLAGKEVAYNLMAHDGGLQESAQWANAVSEPFKTEPNQKFENFDLTLNRGATVRGRVIGSGDRIDGNLRVRAAAWPIGARITTTNQPSTSPKTVRSN